MSIIRPKKLLKCETFESIETLNQFEKIRKHLLNKILHIGTGSVIKKKLVQFVIQLLHLQENLLAKKSHEFLRMKNINFILLN